VVEDGNPRCRVASSLLSFHERRPSH
jgi:hypothetical protein